MYSFTVKSKVFQKLIYIRQERANERYRNTMKDLLLLNTVSQKCEKPHTPGLDDTAIPHIKIKIFEIPLKKSSILQYRKPPCPPLKWIEKILKKKNNRTNFSRYGWSSSVSLLSCLVGTFHRKNGVKVFPPWRKKESGDSIRYFISYTDI